MTGRKQDQLWDEFTIVHQRGPDKPHPDVLCPHCRTWRVNSAQLTRDLVRHFESCDSIPTDVKAKHSTRIAKLKKGKRRSSNGGAMFSPVKSRRTSYGSSTHQTPVLSDTEIHEVHVELARGFYTAGIPFRAIENPHLQSAFTRCNPAFRLPTRRALATSLLNEVYQVERSELAEILKPQKRLTLVTDGWTNTCRESIVNYVLTSPKMRPMMWSSGTTGSANHTGEFMAEEILRVIGEVEELAGIGKVTSVVSDNAPNMRLAGKLVEARRPNVVYSGCAAHAMNLLLKDIYKLPLLKEVLQQALKVTKFVRARNLLLAGVRKNRMHFQRVGKKKIRELALPVATRWYSQEKCIRSVLSNKSPLTTAFTNSQLMRNYEDTAENKAKLEKIQDIVRPSSTFWTNAWVVQRLTAPITRSLAALESDLCSNSMILHEFDRLMRSPEYKEDLHGLHDRTVQPKIRDAISKRWDFVCSRSSITSIAYLLDPSKSLSAFATFEGISVDKVVDDAVKLAKRTGHVANAQVTEEVFENALMELVGAKDDWDVDTWKANSSKPPLDWWIRNNVFSRSPVKRFAQHVLSSPTSSAASERLWSIQGLTHTKLRNRLSVPSVEKLSFIRNNCGNKNRKGLPVYATPPAPTERDDGEEEVEEDEETAFDLDDEDFELLLESLSDFDEAD